MSILQNKKNIDQFLKQTFQSEDFKIQPLAGDASLRKYYRTTSTSKDSYVLMVCDPFDSMESEPFISVHKHFLRNKVSVPHIINVSPSRGMILLEDLGDLTLEKKILAVKDLNEIKSYYQQSLKELAKIHYKATEDKTDFSGIHIEFNTKSFLIEMNLTLTHILKDLCKLKVDALQEKILENDFRQICQRLDREPKLICHRDYHSRNLMLKDSKIYIIDFQDARMGPVQYDLVSLLRDSYVLLKPEIETQLLTYYLELRKSYCQPAMDINHFYKIYELQTIQRCFKACGSFASFYNLRGDKRYLKYIPLTLKRVESSLSCFSEFQGFQNVLHTILKELDLPI